MARLGKCAQAGVYLNVHDCLGALDRNTARRSFYAIKAVGLSYQK